MDDTTKITRVRLTLDRGYQFVAEFPGSSTVSPIRVDEAPPLGEGHGPNPAALLTAAIGNCLAASLLFCLRKARVAPEGLDVTAEAHLVRNQRGRYRVDHVDVELSLLVAEGDEPGLQRCEGLFEDFCIVTESVRHGIAVNVKVHSSLDLLAPGAATRREGGRS